MFVVLFHCPKELTLLFPANGQLAVDFFFCLSGFVIAFAYERRLNEGLSIANFSAARLIRLYPLYALSTLSGLILSGLVTHFVFHAHFLSILAPLFFLSVFLWPTRLSFIRAADKLNFPLNGPAWSLFYEILSMPCL